MMLLGLGGLAAVAWWRAGGRSAGRPVSLQAAVLPGVAVAVVGFAFVNPSVSALVSQRADPARQGEVLGVNQSFAALGRILGPLVGIDRCSAWNSRAAAVRCRPPGCWSVVVALLPADQTRTMTTEPQRHRAKTA